MKELRLSALERVTHGYTHLLKLTHADLTETTANTAQTIALTSVKAGSVVKSAAAVLKVPFEDASDVALNSTTIIIGDDDNDDRFVESTQVNKNGTEVTYAINPAANVPHVYTAANTIDIVVGSMSGKSLADIDVGELWVFLEIQELSDISFG